MIAYCGLDCSKCIGYLATRSGDPERLAAVAKEWSKQFHADVRPEHVICDGCKAEKRKSYHCANLCNIRKCCTGKGYDSCIECGDYACSDVSFVLDSVPEARGNLENLQK